MGTEVKHSMMNFASLPKAQKVQYAILCITALVLLIWMITTMGPVGNYNNLIPLKRNNVSEEKPFTFSEDYNFLINITFSFTRLPLVCNPIPPPLLVFVISSPDNFDRRKAIRETWGRKDPSLKVLFAIGMSEKDNVIKNMEDEYHKHEDLVQGSFLDSYHNLTYKHVMVLKYVVYHCPAVQYLLKVDDDVFVNMPNMKNFIILYNQTHIAKPLMLCSRMYGNPVLREGKWGVSVKEYPGSMYPNHCSGFAVIFTHDAVFSLYSAGQKTKYFWIDDVHVTGTLAKMKNISHIGIENLVLTNSEVQQVVDFAVTNITRPFLYGRMNLDINQIRKLWDYVSKYPPKTSILEYLIYS